jgi:hypothetical protein
LQCWSRASDSVIITTPPEKRVRAPTAEALLQPSSGDG